MLTGLLITTMLLLAVLRLSAQSNSAQATINIRFLPVQTISVNSSEQVVDLLYATTDDFENGVSVTHDDHLTVFSSGGFQVTVESTDENLLRSGGSETIPVGDIVVRASNGSNNSQPALFSDVPLSTTPSPLISAANGGNDLAYSVTYDNTEAGSGQKYINRYVRSNQPETVYTTSVTYSITTR